MIVGCLLKYALFVQFLCLQLYDYVESASNQQKKDHVSRILLKPDPDGFANDHPVIKKAFDSLAKIYNEQIWPVEKLTKYGYLYQSAINDADLHANPVVLVAGPWSTGKSTLINHLLGIEHQVAKLYIGAEPTTADFVVLTYGQKYRSTDASVLTASKNKFFKDLRTLGSPDSLKRIINMQLPSPLLRNLTFVDTPGILENRRLRERGYAYNRIMNWFVNKAQLILMVFDPTKLDVGHEMEALLRQLKGKESLVRIVLNKADSVTETQLMRVYGALFWSLSPLFNVTEAPRVYVSSFRSEQYMGDELEHLFEQEEQNLLDDLYRTIVNRVPNKIANLRSHAMNVRSHALVVGRYAKAYAKNRRWLSAGKNAELAQQIVSRPDDHKIFQQVPAGALANLRSLAHDAPLSSVYGEFFQRNPLENQQAIGEYKSNFFSSKGDLLKKIDRAINIDLPDVLKSYEKSAAIADKNVKIKTESMPGIDERDVKREKKKTPFMEHFETFQPKYKTSGFEDTADKQREEDGQSKQHTKEVRAKADLPEKRVEKQRKPEEIQTDDTHFQKTKIDEETAKMFLANCPIYRKKCEKPIKSEKTSDETPPEPKCIIYRKSCKAGHDLKTLEKEKQVTFESVQEPVRKIEIKAPPNTIKKCPIYRKTCDLSLILEKSMQDTKLTGPGAHHDIVEEPKCIIYRKSCRPDKSIIPKPHSNVEKHFEPSHEPIEATKEGLKKEEKKRTKTKPAVEKRVKSVPAGTPKIKPDTKKTFDKKQGIIPDKNEKPKQEKRPKRKKYDHQTGDEDLVEIPVEITPMVAKSKANLEDLESVEEEVRDSTTAGLYEKAKPEQAEKEQIAAAAIDHKVGKSEAAMKYALPDDCPIYRKSCKSAEKKLAQPANIVSESEKSIPYRKSGQGKDNTATDKSKSAQVTDGRSKSGKTEEKIEESIAAKVKSRASLKQSNLDAEKRKPPSKKQAHRTSDEEKQTETKSRCNIYRKSCTPSADGKRRDDGLFFDVGAFFGKLILTAKSIYNSAQPGKKSKTPCPIYRKSCGSRPKKPTAPTIPLEPSIEKDTRIKKSTEMAPTEKQETIAPKDRTEETVLEKSNPSEPEKCLLYRKSCTIVAPTTSKSVSPTKFEHLSQQGPTVDQHLKNGEKCPPYRKSCSSSVKVHKAPEKLKSNKPTVGSKPSSSSKKKLKKRSSVPCPVYRKSCAPETIKTTSKEKLKYERDYVYVLDQETGKVKRYCKKNSATGLDPSEKKVEDMPILERLVRYLCS